MVRNPLEMTSGYTCSCADARSPHRHCLVPAGPSAGSAVATCALGRPVEQVPPLVGALLKNEQDLTLLEKLVFMQRQNR